MSTETSIGTVLFSCKLSIIVTKNICPCLKSKLCPTKKSVEYTINNMLRFTKLLKYNYQLTLIWKQYHTIMWPCACTHTHTQFTCKKDEFYFIILFTSYFVWFFFLFCYSVWFSVTLFVPMFLFKVRSFVAFSCFTCNILFFHLFLFLNWHHPVPSIWTLFNFVQLQFEFHLSRKGHIFPQNDCRVSISPDDCIER